MVELFEPPKSTYGFIEPQCSDWNVTTNEKERRRWGLWAWLLYQALAIGLDEQISLPQHSYPNLLCGFRWNSFKNTSYPNLFVPSPTNTAFTNSTMAAKFPLSSSLTIKFPLQQNPSSSFFPPLPSPFSSPKLRPTPSSRFKLLANLGKKRAFTFAWICNSFLLCFFIFILMPSFYRWWRCRNQEGREEKVYN